MDTLIIERYCPEMAGEWNAFVDASRNGTFLLRRDYMDYHSDRFADCSWVARRNGKLRALLPANLTEDGVLHSHQGLTYGGWILPTGHVDGAQMLDIFEAAVEIWHEAGIRELDYKPMPEIYWRQPAAEDRYALFRLGAVMTGCGLSSSIYMEGSTGFDQMQRRHLRRASELHWHIDEDQDAAPFMKLLTECLGERHGVRPVHNVAEMQMLRDRFPANIRFFVLRLAGDPAPQAGVCVYDTGTVAHAQYIASTPYAREHNLLTPLFHKLITDTYATRRWFDFGISTEDNGRILNRGLLRQKFSYGSSGTVYPRYRLRIGRRETK